MKLLCSCLYVLPLVERFQGHIAPQSLGYERKSLTGSDRENCCRAGTVEEPIQAHEIY